MKADWEKLMEAFKGDANRLVADVDCTAAGKDLCSTVGVRGYPTIKYGDPSALEDYKGGRKYDDLKKHAEEKLGPSCGPANLDLCDAEKKQQIEEFMQLTAADLSTQIEEKNAAMEKLESDCKTFVDARQKKYTESSEKKEADVEAMKSSGLGLMKSVQAHKTSGKSEL